jgi:hypothetical protein
MRDLALACARNTRIRGLERFSNRLGCEKLAQARRARGDGVNPFRARLASLRASRSRQTKSTSRGRFFGDCALVDSAVGAGGRQSVQ